MNVGQVEFSILADGLDATLSKTKELQAALNAIDGSKIHALGGKAGAAGQKLKKGTEAVTQSIAAQDKALSAYDTLLETRMRHIAQFGSRMQSLGGTMRRVTSPFVSVIRGLAMGVGYRALYKVIDGVKGAFERYDTMNTYTRTMANLGYDATKKFSVGTGKAQTAIEHLRDSVVGLPTGLDEIVAAQRTYVAASGDMVKSTKLAIAANNAFVASGLDATRKRFAERQLQNLMSGAKLTTQQWDSLRKNLPLAMNATARELGYAKKNAGQMVTDLKSGKVAADKFVNAFIKVGTEGKISRAAGIMKQTWNAVSENIGNAFKRMGEGILNTLDSVWQKTRGKSFLQSVLGVNKRGEAVGGGITDFIDDIGESIQKFIKTNPEAITNFVETFKSIDWRGILQGYGEFIGTISKIVVGIGKAFGGKTMIQAMLWGNLFGRAIQGLGGMARGLAGPLAKISLLIGSHGALAKLGKAGTAAAAANGATALGQTGAAMSGAVMSWQGVVSHAITVAAIPAVAWAFSEAAEGVKKLAKVKFTGDLAGNMTAIVTAITTMVAGAAAIGTLISHSKLAMLGTAIASGAFLAITKSFQLFGEGLESISKSVAIASKTDLPSDEQINGVIRTARKLATAFSAEGFGSIGKWIDAQSLKTQMEAVEQVADSFKSIRKLGNIQINPGTLKKAKTHFRQISTFVNDIGEFFHNLEESEMQGATTGMGGRYNGYNGQGKKVTPWATLKNEIREFGETMTNLSEGLAAIPTIMRNARNIQKVYRNLSSRGGDNPLDWQAVKTNIGQIADGLFGLLDRGEKGSAWDKLNRVAQSMGTGNLDNVTNMFRKLPSLVNTLWRTWQNIKRSPIFGAGGTFDPLETNANLLHTPEVQGSPLFQLENKVGAVIDAVARIQTRLATVDAAKFNEDTNKINSALTFVKSAINKIQGLSTTGAETAGNVNLASFDTIGTKIGGVIGKIKGQLVGADKMMEGARFFNISLTRITKAIGKMKNLEFGAGDLKGFGSVVTRIKNAIRRFNKIKSPKAKSIRFKVNGQVDLGGLAGKLTSRWQAVMNAWGKITSKSKTITMKVNGQVDTGMLGFGLAAKIQAAVDGVKSYYTKNITVHVNANTTGVGAGVAAGALGALAGVNAVRFSKGGSVKPLYRAFGGFTYMKPRGTDTVPAMLTPGEYVVNRHAVGTYGARFFQALNHTDLTRALNSISMRAGQMIVPKNGASITNNRTTNNTNNAKVTINNNGNGGIGLGMASRFVNALQ